MSTYREESDDDLPMSGEEALLRSLVGRTIVRVEWHGRPPWNEDEALLKLDDGRVIEFGAWGHDYWGATVREVKAVDVAACAHCGAPHLDLEVMDGWHNDQYPRTPFAFCTGGSHVAWVSGQQGGATSDV